MKEANTASHFSSERERGFTVLLAAIVASLVLALGAAILSIAQKEIVLSSLGRDSQYAFFAADTAAECALYWDWEPREIFPTTTEKVVNPICDDNNTIATEPSSDGNTITSYFQFEPNNYCADVYVHKTLVAPERISTYIRADGFSTNCTDKETSPRVLQRSVEYYY